MACKATDQVTTIGIDIGKNSFHLSGLNDGFGSIADLKPCRLQRPLWSGNQTSKAANGISLPPGSAYERKADLAE